MLLGGGGFGMSAEVAAAAGYVVVEDTVELLNLFGGTLVKLSGQFGNGHLPYELDGLGTLPDLSEVTEKALDILEEDPEADHETGGHSVIADNGQGNIPDVSWQTFDHTATDVPVFATGVKAESFTGTLDNTDIFRIIAPR